jgi:hypothetical protein
MQNRGATTDLCGPWLSWLKGSGATPSARTMKSISILRAPLTQVAPVIMDSGMFVLKGGTAINLIASGEK